MEAFDPVLNEVETMFGLSDKSATSLLSSLLAFTNQQGAGLLNSLRQAGFGDSVSSWLSGEAKPISPENLEKALGRSTISTIASGAGLPFMTASSALAFMLPRVVEKIARQPAAKASVVAEEEREVRSKGARPQLWPILVGVLLVLFGVWIWGSRRALRSGVFDAGAAVQLASDKATAALSALSPGASAESVVDVLNLEIINFAHGSAEIPPDSYDFLNKAAVAIRAAPPGTSIEIDGHTDNTGDPENNIQLSQQRALAVQNYLVMHGVDGSALIAKGYGDSKPVATNDTEEGRFRNRRIEFIAVR
jgi:outer membrane protein OmpA-like peptidoglycan-associated protein/uncharacterized protein YidB (DUF937 family)